MEICLSHSFDDHRHTPGPYTYTLGLTATFHTARCVKADCRLITCSDRKSGHSNVADWQLHARNTKRGQSLDSISPRNGFQYQPLIQRPTDSLHSHCHGNTASPASPTRFKCQVLVCLPWKTRKLVTEYLTNEHFFYTLGRVEL